MGCVFLLPFEKHFSISVRNIVKYGIVEKFAESNAERIDELIDRVEFDGFYSRHIGVYYFPHRRTRHTRPFCKFVFGDISFFGNQIFQSYSYRGK